MNLCFIDRSTGLGTVNDLKTKPRGGMINSLFKVSDYLALNGFSVWVLSDIKREGETTAGVKWINEKSNKNVDFSQPFDVLITNRGTGSGYSEIKARHRVLWTHDLPHGGFIPDPQVMRAFSKTVFMSKYAERVWRAYYTTIGKSVLIPNGVDKLLFHPREKNLKSLIYFCHPNRGLERLPFIFDSINTRIGGVTLKAYSGTKMYPIGGDVEPVREMFPITYDTAETDGFHHLDPLPSHKIAKEVGRAGLFIMPTSYPEICSNSVLQSLASGTPVITTGGLGSTPEWVTKKNGALSRYLPNDYMIYTMEIVRHAVNILSDEKRHRKLIRGAAKTKILDWNEVGARWAKMLKSL